MDGEAIQVDGIWLPATETHLVEHMAKNRQIVDGRGTYQLRKLQAALRIVPKNRRRVAVDAGAHVGTWSLHLAKAFQKLVAFEPVPALRDLWLKNVDARNATMIPCALGNESGTVSMQVPLETTGNAHIAIAGQHPGTRGVANPDRIEVVEGVSLRRLDEFDLREVDFVKIDVEGYERQVLLGGEKTIRLQAPVIVIEQKKNEAAYGEPANAALGLLQKWGYKVHYEISGDFILKFCKPCGGVRNVIDKARGKL